MMQLPCFSCDGGNRAVVLRQAPHERYPAAATNVPAIGEPRCAAMHNRHGTTENTT